jgi:hypothetical protein
MSTQAVRNIINNSIARVLPELKRRAREEGEKKLMELKDQLLSPDTIINALKATIDQDTCSIRGKEQFEKKAMMLKNTLDQIETQAIAGIAALQAIEDQVSTISSKADPPEGVPNPIETINTITTSLGFVIEALNYLLMAAPAILGSQISFPGTGGPVSGTVITNTNNSVNLAKAKVKEFSGMFRSLPKQLEKYQKMADNIYDMINKLKNEIQPIIDKIGELKMFIIYLEMDFMDKCNDYFANPNPAVITPPVYPPPNTLDQIIAEAESLYGDLLNSLIDSGDRRAIERIHSLNAEFIKVKQLRARWIGHEGLPVSYNQASYQGAITDYEELYANPTNPTENPYRG